MIKKETDSGYPEFLEQPLTTATKFFSAKLYQDRSRLYHVILINNKIIAQFPKCVCISRCTTVDITIDSMDVDQANNEDDMSVSYNNFSFALCYHI